MKDTQTETGAAPSDACGITLSSLMNLTHKERRDVVEAYHDAAWACHIVMMMSSTLPPMSPAAFKNACDRFSHGNNGAARIAHDYLTLGKDIKLPVVPPEWYRAVEEAQDTLYAQNAHE
mgnify:CR=1 FL=1